MYPDDFEDIDAEIKKIRSDNKGLLNEFADWLSGRGLAEATIKRHLSNIDFYINEFLVYSSPLYPEAGMDGENVSLFLGFWFIRKASWASSSTLKSNAASLKHFGEFLYQRNMIEQEERDSIINTIRDEMPSWQATLARYDDPDITDMEDIFL